MRFCCTLTSSLGNFSVQETRKYLIIPQEVMPPQFPDLSMVGHINTYSHHSLRHTASSVVHKTNDKGIKVPVLDKLHPEV